MMYIMYILVWYIWFNSHYQYMISHSIIYAFFNLWWLAPDHIGLCIFHPVSIRRWLSINIWWIIHSFIYFIFPFILLSAEHMIIYDFNRSQDYAAFDDDIYWCLIQARSVNHEEGQPRRSYNRSFISHSTSINKNEQDVQQECG